MSQSLNGTVQNHLYQCTLEVALALTLRLVYLTRGCAAYWKRSSKHIRKADTNILASAKLDAAGRSKREPGVGHTPQLWPRTVEQVGENGWQCPFETALRRLQEVEGRPHKMQCCTGESQGVSALHSLKEPSLTPKASPIEK